MASIVKTSYGVWKCQGCGYIVDSTLSEGTITFVKPISIQKKEGLILPQNPIETVQNNQLGKGSWDRRKRTILKKMESEKSSQKNRGLYTPDELESNLVLKESLLLAVDMSSNAAGWANLGLVGIEIRKIQYDFNVKSYGCKKFYELIQKIDLFEIKEQQVENSQSKFIFVKRKESNS